MLPRPTSSPGKVHVVEVRCKCPRNQPHPRHQLRPTCRASKQSSEQYMNRFFSTRIMSKRISFQVTGRVQGVFFRASTVEAAQKIGGLTGYVRNASDGSVVGEAQGGEDQLSQFVQYLNQGPPAAKVDRVLQSDVEPKSDESGFEQ
ncbi:Acylphosphatase-domain-containing protein [Phyllosticta capitalensis]